MSDARQIAEKILKNWSAEFGITGLWPDSLSEVITAALEAKERENERLRGALEMQSQVKVKALQQRDTHKAQRDEAVRLLSQGSETINQLTMRADLNSEVEAILLHARSVFMEFADRVKGGKS